MLKTEYTVENGGLRMEFDITYILDNAGNFAELDCIRCTKLSVCPWKQFYQVPLAYFPAAAQRDAEDAADQLYDNDIIQQIEGELLAAKRADFARRGRQP